MFPFELRATGWRLYVMCRSAGEARGEIITLKRTGVALSLTFWHLVSSPPSLCFRPIHFAILGFRFHLAVLFRSASPERRRCMIIIPPEPNCTISFLIYLIFRRRGRMACVRATFIAHLHGRTAALHRPKRRRNRNKNIDSERGNLRCIAVIKRNGILHDTLMIAIWRP